MTPYIKTAYYEDVAENDWGMHVDRWAQRLSRKLGFPVAQVRAALVANAAVRER